MRSPDNPKALGGKDRAIPTPLLHADGLTRRVRNLTLLQNISLEIHPGDRLAVVGPSGSGKTVLLRALTLLDPLDAGSLWWHEKPIWPADIPTFRRDVCYLHQRPALSEGTVEQNLRQPFELRTQQHKKFDRPRLIHYLQRLERDASFLEKPHHALSGGEAQITALLRTLQLDPTILLLDEPTSALDAHTGKLVENLLQHWFDEFSHQRALVWITHDPSQAQRCLTTTLTMQAGQLTRGLS